MSLEQPGKKEFKCNNMATAWSSVDPEHSPHSVLSLRRLGQEQGHPVPLPVARRQSGTTTLVPGAEQNPGAGLGVWSYSITKCKTLMTLPHSDLRDPTPWLPSLPLGPQRFADLKENVDNIPASKNSNRLELRPGISPPHEGTCSALCFSWWV